MIPKQDAFRNLSGGGPHEMRYVYLLQSDAFVGQRYVGITSDLKHRLAEHNAGKSSHTSKYVPWKRVTYIAFSDVRKAEFLSVTSNPVPATLSRNEDYGRLHALRRENTSRDGKSII
jgi:hypothetical protein